MLNEIFDETHYDKKGGHFGTIKTYLKINSKYWEPQLFKDIKNLCEKCHKCNLIKHIKRKLIIPNIKPIPARQMEVVELDIQGPYIKSENGNRYLVVSYDY